MATRNTASRRTASPPRRQDKSEVNLIEEACDEAVRQQMKQFIDSYSGAGNKPEKQAAAEAYFVDGIKLIRILRARAIELMPK